MHRSDVIIIGGGIVGLATAYQLQQAHPQISIALLEKEAEVAAHQTGRNSGVLHSGIYYRPGSLKATNCRLGKQAMEAFCREAGIRFERCGKVIVAVTREEVPRLKQLFLRGRENGIACEWIDAKHLQAIEPNVQGIQAIHVKEAGIVNYKHVCAHLQNYLQERGQNIFLNTKVDQIHLTDGEVTIETALETFRANRFINCAGLHCDRVARNSQHTVAMRIVPFRGEYFKLKPSAQHLCKHLIYPVPDLQFPFLGVHFTRMVDGSVECGPNAVFAFGREAYSKTDLNWVDLAACLTYPGFIKMAAKHWQHGLGELWRSYSKAAFVKALQRLIPDIKANDIEAAPAGIRAQAITPDGKLVDDFMIERSGKHIHVCNAPSPAATAALQIGKTIVDNYF